MEYWQIHAGFKKIADMYSLSSWSFTQTREQKMAYAYAPLNSHIW